MAWPDVRAALGRRGATGERVGEQEPAAGCEGGGPERCLRSGDAGSAAAGPRRDPLGEAD